MSTHLDVRYGRTRERRRRWLLLAIAAGTALAVAVPAWVVWAGLLTPAASLQSRTLEFDTPTDAGAVVRFEVSMPAGEQARCAVAVLSAKKAIVGWKLVDIPASSDHTRVFEESVHTSEPADTGLIYRCWLT